MGIVHLPFSPGKYTEKGTGQVPCVFLWIRAQTPIPLEKPNSQLVALCVFLWIRAPTPVPFGKTQFATSCVMFFPMDSGPNTDSLGKTQFATSCVMCFPMDSGPNTDSLGKTQFATSCVMCFPMDSGPNTDSLGKTQTQTAKKRPHCRSCIMCFLPFPIVCPPHRSASWSAARQLPVPCLCTGCCSRLSILEI